MPFGKEAPNTTNEVYANIKGLKEENPHFFITRGGGDVIEPEAKYVEGKFLGAERHKFEYKGEEIEQFVIILQDAENTIRVTSSYTTVGRGLLNMLASIDGPVGVLRITLDMGDQYPSVFVQHNKERLKYKIKGDKLKEMIDVSQDKKGKNVYDFDMLNEYLFTQVEKKIPDETTPNPKANKPESDELPF